MTRRWLAPIAIVAICVIDGAAGDVARGSRWWSHVVALADDGMEGRSAGSAADRRAAEYVAAQFRAGGLRPAGTAGYFQPVPMTARRVVEPATSIELVRGASAERQIPGEDLVINAGVDPAGLVEAPLVFAGYGLRIPELQYDDLSGLDVRGAVVVRLAGGPSAIPGPLRSHYQSTAEFSRGLVDAGAVGVVTILNPGAGAGWTQASRARTREAMDLADPGLSATGGLRLALTVNPARAERWLGGSGHTLEELLATAAAGARLPRFPLVPSLRARVSVERRPMWSQNVIAALPGSDPALAHEYVVLSAHLDHLGIGEPGDGDRIYNGALDNAAGVATLLDVAHTLSRRTNARPRRTVVFLAVTAEETGLLGSRYFTARPTVDLAGVVAVVNSDMFLPIHPMRMLTAFGMNESDLGGVVRRVARASDIGVQDDPVPERGTFVRSDQYSFVRKGIPSLMVGVGAEPGSADERLQQAWLRSRYHSPSDDLSQPIDRQAAADYNDFVLALVQALGSDRSRPQWNADSFFRRFSAR